MKNKNLIPQSGNCLPPRHIIIRADSRVGIKIEPFGRGELCSPALSMYN